MRTPFVDELKQIARRARGQGYHGTLVAVEHAITATRLDRAKQVAAERQARLDALAAQKPGDAPPWLENLVGQQRGIWRVLRYLRPGRKEAPTPIWEVACAAAGHKREMRGAKLRNDPPKECASCAAGAPPGEV